MARKKYGIDYPNLYAPTGHKHEKVFNQVYTQSLFHW